MGPAIPPPYTFEQACADFDREIVVPIQLNLNERRYVTSAILVAAAIEPLSGAHLRANAKTDETGYIEWVGRNLAGYEDFGTAIYRTLRCGLLHDMRLDLGRRSDDDEISPSVMLTPENAAPVREGEDPDCDTLIVGVPHLVGAFVAAFRQFQETDDEALRKQFPKRFRLTLIPASANFPKGANTTSDPASAFGDTKKYTH